MVAAPAIVERSDVSDAKHWLPRLASSEARRIASIRRPHRNWTKEIVWRKQTYKPVVRPAVDEAIAQRFAELRGQWKRDTAPLSNAMEIVLHPAYQQIIGLGRQVVPLILEELTRGPQHWSWALFAITGENPIAPEDAGDMERIRQAWLRLACEKGWFWG